MRSFLATDGEAVILKEGLEKTVVNSFNVNLIDYAKGPPSATSIHQPADRCPVFKKIKSDLKKLAASGRVLSNVLLKENMTAAFAEFPEKFPLVNVTADLERKYTDGCIKIIHCFRNGALINDKITCGFTLTGQHREMPDDLVLPTNEVLNGLAHGTVDIDKVLSLCFTEIPLEEQQIMKRKLPVMVEEIKRKGVLCDSFLNEHNIYKLPDHIVRDDFVLWRQNAQLLTLEETVRNYNNYLHQRFLATDPEERRKRKAFADAEKHSRLFEGDKMMKEDIRSKALRKKETPIPTAEEKKQKKEIQQQKTEEKKQKKEQKRNEIRENHMKSRHLLQSSNQI
jgi:hypothetical protein